MAMPKISFPLFDPFKSPDDANCLARAIVDTMPDPILVLDEDLSIIVAESSDNWKRMQPHRDGNYTGFRL